MEMRKLLQTPSPSISKKQKRECHHSINELPDEMLILILSHLPNMKEAARTSVLSHKWERLWTYNPCLVFDGSKELFNFQYEIKGLCDRYHIFKALDVARVKYVNEVNYLLESHHASAIDEFRIRFDLDQRYQSDIDEWVRLAFGKKVKIFELDFSHYSGAICATESCYKLSCTSILGLQSPIYLTSLVLKQVDVSGEVLENLISIMPFLRYLSVGGSKSLVDLKVDGPSICLTYLEIISCDDMKSLELNAPNLLSLKYSGHNIEISFTKVPKLVELCMGEKYVDTFIDENRLPLVHTFASHLQKLVITTPSFSKLLKSMKSLQCTELTQLKQLELKVIAHDNDTLLAFSSLIDASPSLNRFALELIWLPSDIKREVKKVISHHYNLKVVEISGFVGRRVDTEFCSYLIKSAVMLEKLSIDPLNSMLKNPAYGCCSLKKLNAARKRAERLGSKYGLEDKLVIL